MRAQDRYAIPVSDGTDPGGWAAGLRHFVDSRYRVVASTQLQQRAPLGRHEPAQDEPAGRDHRPHGNDGWVLTGFTATADPAATTDFTVTSVRVVGRCGASRAGPTATTCGPDTKLTPSQFAGFFTPWHYARIRMAWEGDWVSIQPVPTSPPAAPAARATTAGRPRRSRPPRQRRQPTPTATPTPSETPLPSDTPDPTPAHPDRGREIAAIRPGRSPARRRTTHPCRGPCVQAGLDPWAVIALAAALLLVVGATIVAGSGSEPGVRASVAARTPGTGTRRT